MKIGSHIKPRSGKARHVPLFGTEYTFEPVKDKTGVTHFVAEVTDPDHAAVLLENGAFYAFDKDKAPQPTLSRGTQEPPPARDPLAKFDDATEAEAKALLDHNADAIGTEVAKVSSLDVVRSAIEQERAGKARKTVIALLEATIQGAVEAGVKG